MTAIIIWLLVVTGKPITPGIAVAALVLLIVGAIAPVAAILIAVAVIAGLLIRANAAQSAATWLIKVTQVVSAPQAGNPAVPAAALGTTPTIVAAPPSGTQGFS